METSAIFIFSCFAILEVALIIYLPKKSFSSINCTEESGTHKLKGQFRRGQSSALLPNPIGQHRYTLAVNSGKLRLCHHSLNPDGFTWSLPPVNGEQEYFDINERGVYTYTITIGESYEKPDIVELVNSSNWDDADFSYRID